MKVAVDARHLTGGRGVAEYTRGMLTALAAEHPEDEWIAFVPGREEVGLGATAGEAARAEAGEPRPGGGGVRFERHALPSRALFGAAAVLGRPRLDRLVAEPDVVWLPAPAPVAVSRSAPLVLTVHDVSWLERPGDFTAYERVWHRLGRLGRLAERADLVVVNAAVNAELLRRYWRVPEHKVRLIRPGIPPRPVGKLPPGLPERFFLAVGALEPRKDPELLVRAHARARTGAGLVFAGSGRLAPALRAPGVTVIERATDAQLGALYAAAIALVSSTRLEGLGFPPLEAAALGTPAVVSDLPVFHETLGERATFVPAGDEDAWVAALEAAAREPREPADVSAYSWPRAAREMRAALAEVAGR